MPAIALQDVRALVVDDDHLMAELVAALLQGYGIADVGITHDAEAALGRLEAESIQLLVCDLGMPGTDGIQLLSRLATHEASPSVILLSGKDPRILDASRELAEARGLRVLGIIAKPVSGIALRAVLRNYDPEAERHAPGTRTRQLNGVSLREGIANGALQLAYQPKVDLRSGRLVGAEGLIRWNDPVLGIQHPTNVVAAAEQCGLIDELTIVTLTRVVEDWHVLAGRGWPINLAVNLSMLSLSRDGIVEELREAVRRAGGAPSDFTFEITETHLAEDVTLILETLLRLRLLGFRLALDDYGTGAATMQLLSQLPTTELKIDRSFVVAGPRSARGRAFLRSAVELGTLMRQTIVAEGVETEDQRELAIELGCHVGQGNLLATPMTLERLIRWASDRGSAQAPAGTLPRTPPGRE